MKTHDLPLGDMPPAHEQSDSSARDFLREKFYTAFGVVLDKYGVSNTAETAELLFDALYARDIVVEAYDIPEDLRFPDRFTVLREKLPGLADTVPAREEFVQAVNDMLTRDQEIHEDSLYPSAKDTVKAMASKGPTVIWTAGDTHGQPQSDRPGSYEQLKKVAGAGIGAIRREIYHDQQAIAVGQVAAGDTNRPRLNDILTVAAAEDKFSPEIIERVVDYLHQQEITEVVVLEDRLAHIQRLLPLLDQHGIHGRGFWLRQGRHGEQASDIPPEITTFDSIEEVGQHIGGLDDDIGFVCDFDGVLSNQAKRKRLQADALYEMMKEHQWIV